MSTETEGRVIPFDPVETYPIDTDLKLRTSDGLYLSMHFAEVDDDRTPVKSIAIAGATLIFHGARKQYIVNIENLLQAACHKITELEREDQEAGPDRGVGAEGGIAGPVSGSPERITEGV